MDAAKAKVVAVVLVLLSLGIWENYRLRLCCNWYKGWWVGAVLGILGLFNFIGLCLCVLEVWKVCRLKYCRQKPVCMCVCVKQRVITECVCVCVCVWGWGFRVYLVNVLFSAPIFLFGRLFLVGDGGKGRKWTQSFVWEYACCPSTKCAA